MIMKNKCIDCQMFDRMTAMANHIRKTSYCSIGKKSFYVRNNKSVACDKFKHRIKEKENDYETRNKIQRKN